MLVPVTLLFLTMNSLSTKFPSLAQPMASSKVMGLYFAASWCPDCTGVTPIIDTMFKVATSSSISSSSLDHSNLHNDVHSLSMVYISSDTTEAQMTKYVPNGWTTVPFAHVEERTGLKRDFGTCSGSEAGPLKVSRKFGIPTLIVIQSDTGKILTTKGVDDVMKDTNGALEKWLTMME
jgi:nucleoredoxin